MHFLKHRFGPWVSRSNQKDTLQPHLVKQNTSCTSAVADTFKALQPKVRRLITEDPSTASDMSPSHTATTTSRVLQQDLAVVLPEPPDFRLRCRQCSWQRSVAPAGLLPPRFETSVFYCCWRWRGAHLMMSSTRRTISAASAAEMSTWNSRR